MFVRPMDCIEWNVLHVNDSSHIGTIDCTWSLHRLLLVACRYSLLLGFDGMELLQRSSEWGIRVLAIYSYLIQLSASRLN